MLLFRALHRTYRLVCLRSTTPEELYARKVTEIMIEIVFIGSDMKKVL